MLSLSKRTDYALLALSRLHGVADSRALNAREIADHFAIPPELLAKILQRLARAGLVASAPGPAGGYRLSKPATDISVSNVIEAVDGLPAIAHCFRTEHSECGQRHACTIREPLGRINARIIRLLDHISIAEISGEPAAGPTIQLVAPEYAHGGEAALNSTGGVI